ncbi:MAG: GTP-dependent dephospho-CoA kinase family protein, partial [Candidatus Bathyarchaeia archaeon]
RNLIDNKMTPQLSITDNKRMRKRLKPRVFAGTNVVHVKNPQGTITEEAIAAIREALESDGPIHIIVDGEEDLLALVAILYAPEKSLVIYGQPYEGVVVVEATSEKKTETMEILKAMKTVRKAK